MLNGKLSTAEANRQVKLGNMTRTPIDDQKLLRLSTFLHLVIVKTSGSNPTNTQSNKKCKRSNKYIVINTYSPNVIDAK